MVEQTSEAELPELRNLVDGQWVAAAGECTEVFNPSTGRAIARVPLSGPSDVTAAVDAAQRCQAAWGEMPVVERARYMFRYRDLLERELEPLAELITREHGKTLSESRAEVRRGIEVVEFACGIPSLLMGSCLPAVAGQIDAETARHPVGISVGITPYNFPAMVPLWMLPIALVCGNPFILKPSEKVPLTAIRLAELLLETDLPRGVFQLLLGQQACVDGLLDDPRVAAISFVGSTPLARSIYQRGTAAGKRVQAAGGAKNHFVIMPDAELDVALEALTAAAFGCGGQRCMATSVAVPVGGVADEFVAELARCSERWQVGPTDPGVAGAELAERPRLLGPLIRADQVDRVGGYVDGAEQAGAQVVLDGRQRTLPTPGFFIGPSLVDHVPPDSRLYRDEIFGPLLSVVRVAGLDQALELGRRCPYGNGASIFTRDGYAAREFQRHFEAGMIGINVGVPAPMAWFPFTGWNSSFFGDLHVQGLEGIYFYTRQKVTLKRWYPPQAAASGSDPLWRG